MRQVFFKVYNLFLVYVKQVKVAAVYVQQVEVNAHLESGLFTYWFVESEVLDIEIVTGEAALLVGASVQDTKPQVMLKDDSRRRQSVNISSLTELFIISSLTELFNISSLTEPFVRNMKLHNYFIASMNSLQIYFYS